MHDGAVVPEAVVQVPLRMMNRHGLIAGATGTGKTKTLQGIAEQLSAAGVPVFVADMKGDLSGLAEPGDAGSAAGKRDGRARRRRSRRPASRSSSSSLGGIGPGVPVRATVSDFGPQLLAKVLGANETQEQCLVARLPLRRREGPAAARPLRPARAADVPRLRRRQGRARGHRRAVVGDGRRAAARRSSSSRTAAATSSSASRSSTIADLLRTAPDGRGVISCLELPAVQDKPKLFSTALMWLLAELFEELPEVGDLDKPKLVFFFDEAHLLFDDATKAFLESVAQTVRLIRSKGVGVFFVTQTPKDVPGDVLGQLGNRVQHALRAFTPDDAKALKATVSTFPKSDFYDLEAAAHRDGDRRGGGDDPVRERRSDPGRAHADLAAALADGPGRRRRRRRPRPRRCGPSTANASTTRALAKCSRRAWSSRPPPRRRPTAGGDGGVAPAPKPKAEHKQAAEAAGGGVAAVTAFLQSKQGKQLSNQVMRGVFGLLKKKI